MEMKFSDLAQKISQSPITGKTTLIGVGGPGGSGKSTFAKYLQKAIPNSILLHGDDFLEDGKHEDWWRQQESQLLQPLIEGESARWQRYDWDKKSWAEWNTTEPGGTVILEGVVCTRREWKKYLTYSIWVEAPRKLRLERGLERDGQDALPKWKEWMREEDEFITEQGNPATFADLVVDGSGSISLFENGKFRIISS